MGIKLGFTGLFGELESRAASAAFGGQAVSNVKQNLHRKHDISDHLKRPWKALGIRQSLKPPGQWYEFAERYLAADTLANR